MIEEERINEVTNNNHLSISKQTVQDLLRRNQRQLALTDIEDIASLDQFSDTEPVEYRFVGAYPNVTFYEGTITKESDELSRKIHGPVEYIRSEKRGTDVHIFLFMKQPVSDESAVQLDISNAGKDIYVMTDTTQPKTIHEQVIIQKNGYDVHLINFVPLKVDDLNGSFRCLYMNDTQTYHYVDFGLGVDVPTGLDKDEWFAPIVVHDSKSRAIYLASPSVRSMRFTPFNFGYTEDKDPDHTMYKVGNSLACNGGAIVVPNQWYKSLNDKQPNDAGFYVTESANTGGRALLLYAPDHGVTDFKKADTIPQNWVGKSTDYPEFTVPSSPDTDAPDEDDDDGVENYRLKISQSTINNILGKNTSHYDENLLERSFELKKGLQPGRTSSEGYRFTKNLTINDGPNLDKWVNVTQKQDEWVLSHPIIGIKDGVLVTAPQGMKLNYSTDDSRTIPIDISIYQGGTKLTIHNVDLLNPIYASNIVKGIHEYSEGRFSIPSRLGEQDQCNRDQFYLDEETHKIGGLFKDDKPLIGRLSVPYTIVTDDIHKEQPDGTLLSDKLLKDHEYRYDRESQNLYVSDAFLKGMSLVNIPKPQISGGRDGVLHLFSVPVHTPNAGTNPEWSNLIEFVKAKGEMITEGSGEGDGGDGEGDTPEPTPVPPSPKPSPDPIAPEPPVGPVPPSPDPSPIRPPRPEPPQPPVDPVRPPTPPDPPVHPPKPPKENPEPVPVNPKPEPPMTPPSSPPKTEIKDAPLGDILKASNKIIPFKRYIRFDVRDKGYQLSAPCYRNESASVVTVAPDHDKLIVLPNGLRRACVYKDTSTNRFIISFYHDNLYNVTAEQTGLFTFLDSPFYTDDSISTFNDISTISKKLSGLERTLGGYNEKIDRLSSSVSLLKDQKADKSAVEAIKAMTTDTVTHSTLNNEIVKVLGEMRKYTDTKFGEIHSGPVVDTSHYVSIDDLERKISPILSSIQEKVSTSEVKGIISHQLEDIKTSLNDLVSTQISSQNTVLNNKFDSLVTRLRLVEERIDTAGPIPANQDSTLWIIIPSIVLFIATIIHFCPDNKTRERRDLSTRGKEGDEYYVF